MISCIVCTCRLALGKFIGKTMSKQKLHKILNHLEMHRELRKRKQYNDMIISRAEV